jgi:hypothetical protein
MFPNRVPLERDALSPEPLVYHSFISVRVPQLRSPPMKWGKTYGHHPQIPTQAERKWDVAWFPKGIVYDTAITTPVPCSLQRNTFHFGLGRPEPCSPACVVVTPPHLLPLPT